MGLSNENYANLITNLEKRKGKKFFSSNIKPFLDKLLEKKDHTGYDVYQTYRFESYFRSWFYVYLDVIEKSLLGRLLDYNEDLQYLDFSHDNGWTFYLYYCKFFNLSTPKDYKMPSNWNEVQNPNELEAIKLIRNSEIFRDNISHNFKTLHIIKDTRNDIQHFQWILNKEKTQIKKFIQLFSQKYQNSFSSYILSEILHTFTTYETCIEIIKWLETNMGLFSGPDIKKIIKDVTAYKPDSNLLVKGSTREKHNEERIKQGKEPKSEKDWPYYASYVERRNIGNALNENTRQKIFKNNSGITN